MSKFIFYAFVVLILYICICFAIVNWQLTEMSQNLILQSQLTRKSIEINSQILDEFWEWKWQNLSEREKASILNYCEKKNERESYGLVWDERGIRMEGE